MRAVSSAFQGFTRQGWPLQCTRTLQLPTDEHELHTRRVSTTVLGVFLISSRGQEHTLGTRGAGVATHQVVVMIGAWSVRGAEGELWRQSAQVGEGGRGGGGNQDGGEMGIRDGGW